MVWDSMPAFLQKSCTEGECCAIRNGGTGSLAHRGRPELWPRGNAGLSLIEDRC
jgi:hypothetical protein